MPHIHIMSIVAELLELLELEKLEVNIYRGQNRDLGTGRVFGGQVFAQALVAARRTVDEPREAHSVHGYFLRPGDLKAPIVYFVDRPRDGGTFTSRRVTAIQHGEAIFHLSASFHVEEPGLDHQERMPQVQDPDTIKPELEQVRENAQVLPPELRTVLTQDRPIDFRSPQSHLPGGPAAGEPERYVWFRVSDRIHHCRTSAILCRLWPAGWHGEFRQGTVRPDPAEWICRIAMLPEPARIRGMQGSVQRGAASVLSLKGSSNELGRSDVAGNPTTGPGYSCGIPCGSN
jgi:hypothetical protein